MHVFPLREKCRVDRGKSAELYGPVDHKIDIAEEYRHVACRSQPELDGGVAHECGPHPEPSGKEAGHYQHTDRLGVGAYHVGSDQSRATDEQSGPVGEAEFQPEHDGEINRHAHKRGISGHQYILLHQSRSANHVGGGGKVDTAGKLDYQHEENEQPGLQPPRNEVRDIGDVKWPLGAVPVSHISISPHIPHSFRHATAACPRACCRP